MTGTAMKKGTSLSASPDSFCRIPSGNAVSADASAAMNLYALCRALAQRCPWICIGPCTLLSTSLIERAKKAYNITVSTSFYLLPGDTESTLQEMLAHADAMLYEEKQKRDKNVAKILPK